MNATHKCAEYLRHLTVIMTLVCLTTLAYANPLGHFPENYEMRVSLKDTIFGTNDNLMDSVPTVQSAPGALYTVKFEVMRQNGAFYLVFSNEIGGEHPTSSPGSYVVKRDIASGEFLQVKIFLGGPETFVRIYPLARRTEMEVFLLGEPVYRNIVLPISMDEIILEPLARVLALSSSHVDWSLFYPSIGRPTDRTAENMVNTIRGLLGTLKDSDDGAMDANGTFRYIEDLTPNLASGFNCSGFAKWVVDGLYLPRTGQLLPIEQLKVKHPDRRGSGFTEHYEDSRDPYFGLDWSRNLAIAMRSHSLGYVPDIESADVRHVAFHTYTEDVGFPVEDIRQILYILAKTEPGYFYIGSVNREFGADPVLKQHVHVVVLFPYFRADGGFEVAVMERNLETSVDSLIGRYRKDHIHLVRVPVSDTYSPPAVEFY